MVLIQKLINYFYRYPKSNWKTIQRFGGYFSYRKMMSAKKQMQNASRELPSVPSHAEGLPIYFLTGKKYIYQTLFCAYSLVNTTTEKFQFTLVDDGSFDEELIQRAKQQMPNVRVVLKAEIEQNLKDHLPLDAFPHLHLKRKIYPHIKKLTDIHTINPNTFKLVLDSDMLFWNEPTELINWLKSPNGCIYMLDCEESYGYDRVLLESLCASKVPVLMNVGTFGINSNIVNWNNLEEWSKALEEKQSASYFLEQALSAMLIANEQKTILNKEEYVVNPDEKSLDLVKYKLHHYVDLSKKYYFEKAWRKTLQ